MCTCKYKQPIPKPTWKNTRKTKTDTDVKHRHRPSSIYNIISGNSCSISSSKCRRLASGFAYHVCLWTLSRWWGGSHCSRSPIGHDQVDVYGVHSLVCNRASGNITRHQALMTSSPGLSSLQIYRLQFTKKPNGFSISDNKRPAMV